jgi:hypothetical protein
MRSFATPCTARFRKTSQGPEKKVAAWRPLGGGSSSQLPTMDGGVQRGAHQARRSAPGGGGRLLTAVRKWRVPRDLGLTDGSPAGTPERRWIPALGARRVDAATRDSVKETAHVGTPLACASVQILARLHSGGRAGIEGVTMSRGLEIDDGRDERRAVSVPHRETAPRPVPVAVRGRAADPRLRSATLPDRAFMLPRGPEREPVPGRHRRYRLRGSESQVLTAAGLFRVVFERDLQQTAYRDDPTRLGHDVRHLLRQGLLERHTIAADHRGRTVAVLNLTCEGQRLLEQHRALADDARHLPPPRVSSGWHKVAEVVHDASVFRMYQVEAARIEAAGGVVQRVVLGDELKRQCYAAVAPPRGASAGNREAALAQAAARLDLPVVAGHVEFPDLRLEYDTAMGDRTRVDVELVTDAYRPGQIAAKHAAGFTLYSAGGSSRLGIASLGGQGGTSTHGHVSQDRFLSSLLSL